MNDTFGPGDLMQWQDMTSAIRRLEEREKILAEKIVHIAQVSLSMNEYISQLHSRTFVLEVQIRTLQDIVVALNMDIADQQGNHLGALEKKEGKV